jgi:hypothetical protein
VELRVDVLRRRSELSEAVLQCADLALNCIEVPRLGQFRCEGTRCVLVWLGNTREPDHGQGRTLGALFPFGAPAPYRGLPLLAMRSPTPLLRSGRAHACVHALLDWFRRDGEGAALLEIRGLAIGGPVYRVFADVAREREQLVLCATEADGTCTLLVGDRAWDELTVSTLPLSRWAKLGAASLVYCATPSQTA